MFQHLMKSYARCGGFIDSLRAVSFGILPFSVFPAKRYKHPESAAFWVLIYYIRFILKRN